MSHLKIVSYKNVIKVLKKLDFTFAPKRGKGSHLAFYKKSDTKKYLVIVPKSKNIPIGTLLSIIKQMGISKEEFIKLIKE